MLKANRFKHFFNRVFETVFYLASLVKQLLPAVIHRAVLMLKAKPFQTHFFANCDALSVLNTSCLLIEHQSSVEIR